EYRRGVPLQQRRRSRGNATEARGHLLSKLAIPTVKRGGARFHGSCASSRPQAGSEGHRRGRGNSPGPAEQVVETDRQYNPGPGPRPGIKALDNCTTHDRAGDDGTTTHHRAGDDGTTTHHRAGDDGTARALLTPRLDAESLGRELRAVRRRWRIWPQLIVRARSRRRLSWLAASMPEDSPLAP